MARFVDDAIVARLSAELAPALDDLEALRRAELSDARNRIAIIAGLAVLLAVVGLLLGDGNPFWVFVALVLAGIAIAGWGVRPYADFKDQAAETLMPAICAALGDLAYTRRPGGYDHIHVFEDLGVVPFFNRASFYDLLRGSHRDTDFSMVQATLRRRRRSTGRRGGSRNRTVFRGLLFTIAVPRPIAGPILIARDMGAIGNAFTGFFKQFSDLGRVTFDHAEFERRFEVYAQGAEAARGVLVPSLLDTFCLIDDLFDRRGLQGAFVDRDFLMAVRTQNALTEPLTFLKPLAGPQAIVGALVDQVTIAHRVIDYLHGDRPADTAPATNWP